MWNISCCLLETWTDLFYLVAALLSLYVESQGALQEVGEETHRLEVFSFSQVIPKYHGKFIDLMLDSNNNQEETGQKDQLTICNKRLRNDCQNKNNCAKRVR